MIKQGFHFLPVPHYVKVGETGHNSTRAKAYWNIVKIQDTNDYAGYRHELTHVIQFWLIGLIFSIPTLFLVPYGLNFVVAASVLVMAMDVLYKVPFFRKHLEAWAMAVECRYWMYDKHSKSFTHHVDRLSKAFSESPVYRLDISEEDVFSLIVKWDRFLNRITRGD